MICSSATTWPRVHFFSLWKAVQRHYTVTYGCAREVRTPFQGLRHLQMHDQAGGLDARGAAVFDDWMGGMAVATSSNRYVSELFYTAFLRCWEFSRN